MIRRKIGGHEIVWSKYTQLNKVEAELAKLLEEGSLTEKDADALFIAWRKEKETAR